MILGLVYAIGFFVTWILATRHVAAQDDDDPFIAVALGLLAAIMWPFVVLGVGVWRLANPNSTERSSK